MKQFFFLCLLVFVVVWGIGIVISFMVSADKTPVPSFKTLFSDESTLEKRRKFATETYKKHDDLMDTYEYQQQQQRRMLGMQSTSFGQY